MDQATELTANDNNYGKPVHVLTKHTSKDKLVEEEAKLMARFLADHQELPAWNKAMKKEYFPWVVKP